MTTEKATFGAGCFWGVEETLKKLTEQKAAAESSKEKIDKSGRFRRPVVTQVEAAPRFWRAEEYHQRYLEKRGQAHCAI